MGGGVGAAVGMKRPNDDGKSMNDKFHLANFEKHSNLQRNDEKMYFDNVIFS